jgi:hypothetical protein
MAALPKPSAAARRLAKHQTKSALKSGESKNKQAARRRDGHRCRFPLCGCRRLRLRNEVAHLEHKGQGGDPLGRRSETGNLILLCVQRHQDGAVSWHHGTMRVRPLTPNGTDGPVAFETWDVAFRNGWAEVARESAVQQLEPLLPWQQTYLERLAGMAL